MVVGDLGGADALAAAQGRELGEGAAERGGGGARGAEEVELVEGQGASLGLERGGDDRGRGRAGFEAAAHQTHEHAQVERRRGEADATCVAPAPLEREHEAELGAGEPARLEPREQAREQALEHEAQRLELLHRELEVDGFEKTCRLGDGQRQLRLFAARERDQPQHGRAQARAESAARELQQIAQRAHAQTRERLGQGVVRIEQIDGQRRQPGALGARGQHADLPGPRRGGGEPARGEVRHAARRGEGDAAGQPERARPRGERGAETGLGAKQRGDPRGIEQHGGFAGVGPRGARSEHGPRRAAERRVEQRIARGLLEGRREDAHPQLATDHTGMGKRAAPPYAPARRLGRNPDDLGARARARSEREREARELGLRSQLGREREIGHQAASDADFTGARASLGCAALRAGFAGLRAHAAG